MSGRSGRLSYRWVVLATFMLLNLALPLLWISYTPISAVAASFYGVTGLKISLLGLTFMMAFIPLSLPVAWVIDTYGFRPAVSLGALLMVFLGLMRALVGTRFPLVLLSTVGLALAQPFLLNAWTRLAAVWFVPGERLTAVGLVNASRLLGIILGLVLTPLLIRTISIPSVQLIYGGLAALAAILFFLFAREHPAVPTDAPGMERRLTVSEGWGHIFTRGPFWTVIFISFVGMGIYNGLFTRMENIIRPRGFSSAQAGMLLVLMLAGGALGSVVLSRWSDSKHSRTRFLLIGMVLAIPGLLGLMFGTRLWLLGAAAFTLGFFLIGSLPVGIQVAAEMALPASEASSTGLVQLFGQASLVFVYGMDVLKRPDGTFTPALLLALGLMAVCVMVIVRLQDPPVV